jgi:hypothetical protein
MGAISDSNYFTQNGILEQEDNYLQEFDANKGYRVMEVVWRVGRKFVLQLSFARSKNKFTTEKVARSAAVASDKGRNKRVVRLAKLKGTY